MVSSESSEHCLELGIGTAVGAVLELVEGHSGGLRGSEEESDDEGGVANEFHFDN